LVHAAKLIAGGIDPREKPIPAVWHELVVDLRYPGAIIAFPDETFGLKVSEIHSEDHAITSGCCYSGLILTNGIGNLPVESDSPL